MPEEALAAAAGGAQWEEKYDLVSNRKFYVNTETKERQWTRPGKDALVFVHGTDWVMKKDKKTQRPAVQRPWCPANPGRLSL